jgi:hypothetical protein
VTPNSIARRRSYEAGSVVDRRLRRLAKDIGNPGVAVSI